VHIKNYYELDTLMLKLMLKRLAIARWHNHKESYRLELLHKD